MSKGGGGGGGGGGGFGGGGVGLAAGLFMVNGAVTSWTSAIVQSKMAWIDLELKESQWAYDTNAAIKPPPIGTA